MSILQDLDPKYAKIHTQSSFAGWKSITWILSLLLVLLWASWLVFTLQRDDGASKNILTANIGRDQGSLNTEAVKSPTSSSPSQATTSRGADSSPASTGGGSAVIQESREAVLANSAKSDESAPFASIAPESKKSANSGQATKPEAREETAQQKSRKATEHTAERKQANRAYAEKNSQPATKKAAERDIDIITAIVR